MTYQNYGVVDPSIKQAITVARQIAIQVRKNGANAAVAKKNFTKRHWSDFSPAAKAAANLAINAFFASQH